MDQTPKQLVTQQLKAARNIVLTTSVKPSVDDVVSAVGLGLMLKKLDKHAITVISGELPAGIEFITKTAAIDKTTDNTRDFVIEFDRNKVDKLRYKKEDDVVKIFLTPFGSAINEKDFRFSQGDYNVDTVVMVGVTDKDQLDGAVANQNRMIHDASVITLNAGNQPTGVAGINWTEPEASSVSEMLVSISEALSAGLLDDLSATALLSGIIANTDHFTNSRTTPKVMTMAAQLMAAGANQQQIMSELKKAHIVNDSTPVSPAPTSLPPVVEKSGSDDMTIELESSLSKEFDIDHKTESAKPSENFDTSAIDNKLEQAQKLAEEQATNSFTATLPATATHNNLMAHQSAPLNQPPTSQVGVIAPPPVPVIRPVSTQVQSPLPQPQLIPKANPSTSSLNVHPGAPVLQPLRPSVPQNAPIPPIPTVVPVPAAAAPPTLQPVPVDDQVVDVEKARQAVAQAVNSAPFNPANNPTQAIGSQTLGDTTQNVNLNI